MPRAHCPACLRPLPTCLCRWVRPTAHAVEVRVLQHPDEAGQAKGSLRLLQMSLQDCRVRVGETFAGGFGAAPDAGAEGRTVLLYPATESAPGPLADRGLRPQRLVVLDATWRKSLRMLHADPALRALPRWPLHAVPATVYAALRKAGRPGQLSTLEASCLALAEIEGDAPRFAPLLEAFGDWVRMQVRVQGQAQAARRLHAAGAGDGAAAAPLRPSRCSARATGRCHPPARGGRSRRAPRR